ncbi:MAG: histidine kinase, partial [Chromatiaceae bacterium]|nr:histidine kinase [Chromatiaceae bacterium]
RDRALGRVLGGSPWGLYRAFPPQFAAAILPPEGEGLLGFTAAELCSYPDLRCRQLYEEDRTRVLTTFAEALESGQGYAIQYRLWDRERRTLHLFRDYAQVQPGPNGRPEHLAGVLVDITKEKLRGPEGGLTDDLNQREAAQRALAESEERLRSITGAAQDAILMLDDAGRIGFWNAAATRIFGYTEQEAMGQDAHLLLTPSRLRCMAREGFRTFSQTGAGPVLGKTLRFDAVRRDGTEVPVELSVSALKRRDRWHTVGVIRDVSDREAALEKARESETRFRTLFEEAADGLLIADPETGRFVQGNARMAALLRCRQEDLPGLGVEDIHPEGDLPQVLEEFRHMATQQHGEALDIPVKRRDGTGFTANVSSNPIRLDGRDFLVGAFRDMTERQEAERQLAAERKLLRDYLDNAPVVTAAFDRQGVVQLINRRGCELLGLPEEKIVGRHWFSQFVAPEDQGRALHAFTTCLTSPPGLCGSSEYCVVTARGEVRRIAWLTNVIRDEAGDSVALMVSGADVTERRRMEQELIRAQERLKLIANTVPAVLYACAPEEGLPIRFAGANLQDQFGIDAQRAIGRPGTWSDYAHPADLPRLAEAGSTLSRCGSFAAEFRLCRPDGECRWAQIELRLTRTEDGPAEVVGYLLDVTQRRQAEDALREREASLAHAQAIANLGSWETNLETGAENWSDEVYRILGYAPRSMEPCRERLMERIHPDDREPFSQRIAEAVARESGFGAEFRVVRPDGEERFVRARGQIVRDGEGKGCAVVGTLLDFTQRRRDEIALERSRETLRELAAHLQTVREEQRAEIAREIHDEMGQGLTAMKIDLVRLRSRLRGRDAQVTALVGSLLASVDTTITAVQRIMAELRPALLDDLGLVAAIEWLTRQFTERTGIACRLDLPDSGLELSQTARTALFRILQESLTNVARHAGATQVQVTLERADQSIRLLVEDNGKGISTIDLESGRSFGLLGMRERAAVFGGRLAIRGQAGVGTRVSVTIPASALEGD